MNERGQTSPVVAYQARSHSSIYNYFESQFWNYWETDLDKGESSEVHWEYGVNIPG